MGQTDDFSLGVRVANFTNATLSNKHVLHFDSLSKAETVEKIRSHADLPYVFAVAESQAKRVKDILTSLKAIRSPCYPFALFTTLDVALFSEFEDVDIVKVDNVDSDGIHDRIEAYASDRFRFKDEKLQVGCTASPPESIDVLIVGGGITGLYAANRLKRSGISFCVLEKENKLGGIWSMYANVTSRVNTSEGAYRLVEGKTRSNRDHSATREILEDLASFADWVSDCLFLETEVKQIKKTSDRYHISYEKDGRSGVIESKGVLLAINDRIGPPRETRWNGQEVYQGEVVRGMSNETVGLDWHNKKVVVVGMGAFAIENARTALEGGARHVTVVGRRHGTVCPKIIDYLNFATPYDDAFMHDKKSNIRNMMYWKKLYESSGATQPECWMGNIKHDGHTISVSDIWFVGHYLKKITTVTGSITQMAANGVIVGDSRKIEADIVVNCIGFERNGSVAKSLCGYDETSNINYVDKDFMYLADAYIDDNAFNSFFGSSVLEMTKFYLEVFIKYFDNPRYDDLLRTKGVERIPIDDRKWSHYIAGATALIQNHPDLYNVAKKQVDHRTANFLEKHDLPAYVAENKREWIDTHSLLAGKPMQEKDCLPYLFEKLLPK